jgi:hypothetical protein
MSQPTTPQAQDLILGGQLPPPVGGAVLGGLTGLEHRFNQADIQQKMAALTEATKYGESAIPLLQRGLQDTNLQIRKTAYIQLKSIQPNAPELEKGLPLRVGDRIYAVYESSVTYGDDFYYVCDRIHGFDPEDDYEAYSLYHSSQDADGQPFDYISDAPEDNRRHPYDEGYDPYLITYCLDADTANAQAQIIYEQKFGKLDCEIYEISRDTGYDCEEDESGEGNFSNSFDLPAWVEANQVVVNAKLPYEWEVDEAWGYESRVLMSLQNQKQFALLRELWQQRGFPPLAFVHEHVIDRPCYLRMTVL